MEQTKCKHCDSYMKKRLYTFNLTDDNQNLFCANENCESNKNNEVSFGNKSYQIEYCCKQCHRTLLHENETAFLYDDIISDIYDHGKPYNEFVWDKYVLYKYTDAENYLYHCWLNLQQFDNDSHCNECENYLKNIEKFKNCDVCGSLYKTICNHSLIDDSLKYGSRHFTQNPNKEKCVYCCRYLNKCCKCENSCYVCVFEDCARSQLTGMKLKRSSYLCKKHAAVVTDCWANEIVKQSDMNCQECGINENYYKPSCECIEAESFCLNCMKHDTSIEKVYCQWCI